jgi:lycopene cyclase domain-containing protein
MRHLAYLAALACCVVCTLPLEVWLGARVYRQPRRLALTLLMVLLPFLAWDLVAIRLRLWRFDAGQTVGVMLPGGLPLEEVLFFVVIPTAAVLTLEGVRRLSGWPVDGRQ